MLRNRVFILLTLLAFCGCAGTVKVEKATSQAWHGGAAGSGGGKNYVVTVSKPKRTVVTISQVWVGERDKGWLTPFRVTPQEIDTSGYHQTQRGITEFTIAFSETYPGEPIQRGETRPPIVRPFDNPPHDLPAAFTHGAVIYYRIGEKAGTWVISDFEILPPLNYP